METWLIVCLVMAVIGVISAKGYIYFEALSIGSLASLIVGTIIDGQFLDNEEYALWFAMVAPIASFLISFFRYLPRNIFSHFWATPIFTLVYSSILWMMGITENMQTTFILFFSLSGLIILLIAACAALAILIEKIVRHAIDGYTKSLEEGLND